MNFLRKMQLKTQLKNCDFALAGTVIKQQYYQPNSNSELNRLIDDFLANPCLENAYGLIDHSEMMIFYFTESRTGGLYVKKNQQQKIVDAMDELVTRPQPSLYVPPQPEPESSNPEADETKVRMERQTDSAEQAEPDGPTEETRSSRKHFQMSINDLFDETEQDLTESIRRKKESRTLAQNAAQTEPARKEKAGSKKASTASEALAEAEMLAKAIKAETLAEPELTPEPETETFAEAKAAVEQEWLIERKKPIEPDRLAEAEVLPEPEAPTAAETSVEPKASNEAKTPADPEALATAKTSAEPEALAAAKTPSETEAPSDLHSDSAAIAEPEPGIQPDPLAPTQEYEPVDPIPTANPNMEADLRNAEADFRAGRAVNGADINIANVAGRTGKAEEADRPDAWSAKPRQYIAPAWQREAEPEPEYRLVMDEDTEAKIEQSLQMSQPHRAVREEDWDRTESFGRDSGAEQASPSKPRGLAEELAEFDVHSIDAERTQFSNVISTLKIDIDEMRQQIEIYRRKMGDSHADAEKYRQWIQSFETALVEFSLAVQILSEFKK